MTSAIWPGEPHRAWGVESAWSTVSYPATSGWAQFGTVNTAISLKAGYNVIRLAKGSPHFAGGTGYAELDYIQLT